MTINNIGLLATQSYLQIQNRPKPEISQAPIKEAETFQNVLKQQFNSFSKMSPEQILAHAKSARSSSTTRIVDNDLGAVVYSGIKTLKDNVKNQEITSSKVLTNEASTLDLLTATTEAKNTMDVMVKLRDKFLETFDKFMSMSM